MAHPARSSLGRQIGAPNKVLSCTIGACSWHCADHDCSVSYEAHVHQHCVYVQHELHGVQDTPVADAKPDDIKDLLGGALFKALYKWMVETGPVYLLPTGPASSFLVISDPAAAQHVLQRSDNPKNNVYGKGLVAEVSKFLFGDGFATSGAHTRLTCKCTLIAC